MPLTNTGTEVFARAVVDEATAEELLNEGNAVIGVGDGDAVFEASQTDLQGVNTEKSGMATGYPTRNSNQITLKVEFGADDANFAWEEWGVFNSSGAEGEMVNRKVESLGTKVQGSEWDFTVVLTVLAA